MENFLADFLANFMAVVLAEIVIRNWMEKQATPLEELHFRPRAPLKH